MTWEAWIDPTSVASGLTQDIYRKWNYGGSFLLHANKLYAAFGNGSSSELTIGDSSGTVAANQWSLVAATYNASTGAVNYYINGAAAGSGTIATGQLGGNSTPPSIGAYWTGSSTGEFFGGGLADVAMYPAALSSSQITSDYNAPSQSALASQIEARNPLLYYQLNEPSYLAQYSVPTATSGPLGITVGPDGNLWFTEYFANKIGSLNPTSGQFAEYTAGLSAGAGPNQITAAPGGALWFTEFGTGSIGRITTSGAVSQYQTPSGQTSEPRGIAEGPDGNLWFTEAATNKIGYINPTTDQFDNGGNEYSIPSGNSPNGITQGSDGALWFADNGAGIGRVTTTGQFSSFTSTAGSPGSIAVGADGNLYFSDGNVNEVGRVATSSPYTLTDHAGDVTTFGPLASDGSAVPVLMTQPGGMNHESVIYDTINNQADPVYAISAASGISVQACVDAPAAGCRVLQFIYATSTGGDTAACPTTGGDTEYLNQLAEVDFTAWDPAQSKMTTTPVACYLYNTSGQLSYEWDPRTDATVTPTGTVNGSGLQTQYAYTQGGLLDSLTPPGQQQWTFNYGASPYPGDSTTGSLASVSRTLNSVSSTQTVQYNVGTSTPYSFANAGNWAESTSGAQNTPSTGTAIFPPSDSNPGQSTYNQATIYYLDAFGEEVNVASPPARVLEYNAGLNSGAKPGSVTLGADGNAWFTDQSAGTPAIGKITPTGSITEYSTGLPVGSTPAAITTGPDGNQWFTDPGAGALGKATTAGALTEYSSGLAAATKPTAITSTTSALWFTDDGTTPAIGAINATTDAITEYTTGLNAGSKPGGITASPDGNVWFTDAGATPAIGEINTTTDAITEYATGLQSGSQPSAITAGAGGNLWFTDPGANEIGTINPTTHSITEYSIPTTNSNPTAITLGSDGNVWFVEQDTNQIGKITPTGVITEYAIPTPSSAPAGITTGADGALWFSESAATQIGRITTAGVTGQGWISTTQYDQYYEVASTLSPQNRLEALSNSNPNNEAGLLQTQNLYNGENGQPSEGAPTGTELTQTLGPQHSIVLQTADGTDAAGSTQQARAQTNFVYDCSDSSCTTPGSGPYYLVTTDTTGAQVAGQSTEGDVQTTTTSYGGQSNLGWTLRQPTAVTVDVPSGNLTSTTFYDPATAQPIETVQPADATPAGPNSSGISNDASATQTYYYTSGASASVPSYCQSQPALAGLVCQAQPARQPSDSAAHGLSNSLPSLAVTGGAASNVAITAGISYNIWDEPLQTEQLVWNTSGNEDTRTSTQTYDAAGRTLTSALIATAGTALPTAYDTYHADTGLPWTQTRGTGSGAPTITETYDGYGRLHTYEDANSNTATYTYDIDGRVSSINDSGDSTENQTQNAGNTTYAYDPYTGNPTSVTDPSGISFYGTYDANGDLLAQAFPNAMTANTTFNETGTPTSLTYLQYEKCAQPGGCTPYTDAVASNIHGEWQAKSSTLSSEAYTYDTAGRLCQVAQTPFGGTATLRQYTFNADTDRTKLTTSGTNETNCTTSGGTTQSYNFDSADRLTDTGIAYDSFGRITTTPAGDSGGYTLTSYYYVNDYVQGLTQNGLTTTYTLDPANRISERVQTGTSSSNQLSSYDGPGDTPAWTQNVNSGGQPTGTWTRNITGIDGGLDAIQTNTGTQLQLSNLHGDIIATAPTTTTGTVTLNSCEVTEYGVPCASGVTTTRYSYLGAKQKATELPSGIINMGARVYNPDTGTFLQTDPIPGADANAYGYTDGDPVNETDLSGDVCLRTPNGRCAVPPSGHAAKPKSSPSVVSQVFHFVTSTAPNAVAKTAVTVAPIVGHAALGFLQSTETGLTVYADVMGSTACWGAASEAPVIVPSCTAFTGGMTSLAAYQAKEAYDNYKDAVHGVVGGK